MSVAIQRQKENLATGFPPKNDKMRQAAGVLTLLYVIDSPQELKEINRLLTLFHFNFPLKWMLLEQDSLMRV